MSALDRISIAAIGDIGVLSGDIDLHGNAGGFKPADAHRVGGVAHVNDLQTRTSIGHVGVLA